MTQFPKRILVTGGAGFIGAHLCRSLLAMGHAVTCLDNFSTGREANIAPLRGRPGFTLLRHDVTQPLELDVDEIYNLACPASPAHYSRDPVQTAKTSVIGTLNLLELARRSGARLLQCSTSEVYGDPLVHPQTEDYWGHVNPIGPRACYDEGKRCAETLIFDFRRRYDLPVKVARLFNVYGPGMRPDDGRVVSNFAMQALTGAPLTVYGDGSQTRSFCYVSDMVEALVRLMATPPAVTGPINLGNPAEMRVIDLARTVLRLTGARAPLVFRPLPCDDPVQRRPDIARARAVLGWSPAVGLETGLRATLDRFAAEGLPPAPDACPVLPAIPAAPLDIGLALG
ncbi:UDP-glucuronic acid decarboxylase family protein [Rhodovulum sulfidophilum]|uniref:SDR family oxidoreductase n=2 Tax=Rhodovulum sulfidophilum TaxID=35806 RepID=A0ABS1RPQ2_RHOSU|nr:UDP-glucuronic acid decarboxylase family protein [Rhodovulum sulfidophilum]MBL3608044.1 SDR family oxidoreductase [Rhodovulum sulfidophilum]